LTLFPSSHVGLTPQQPPMGPCGGLSSSSGRSSGRVPALLWQDIIAALAEITIFPSTDAP